MKKVGRIPRKFNANMNQNRYISRMILKVCDEITCTVCYSLFLHKPLPNNYEWIMKIEHGTKLFIELQK